MKAKLDKNGLDRRPHGITSTFWYYEETDGLKCYADLFGAKLLGTIRWTSIRAALKRYDAAKARKATK